MAALGVLLLLALTPRLVSLVNSDPLSDVRAYYDGAARLNTGQPLYPADADVNAAEYYRYPPLLAIAFRPFTGLPLSVVAAGWEVLAVGCFAATLLRIGIRRRRTWTWVCILAFPIAWSLVIGQAQVPVTLLLAIGTPASLALATQLKLLPGLAALYWVGRRDWRSLGAFLAWNGLFVALQAVLEPAGLMAFFRITNLGEVGQINNLSPYALSPVAWAILAVAGAGLVLATARRPVGWFTGVAYSVLVTPRLSSYLLMALLGGLGGRAPEGRRGPTERDE